MSFICSCATRRPLKCTHTKAARLLPTVLNDAEAAVCSWLWADLGDCRSKLSNGLQHSIGIARALVRHPQIVLLDETTGKVDAEVWQAVSKRQSLWLLSRLHPNQSIPAALWLPVVIVVVFHSPAKPKCRHTERVFDTVWRTVRRRPGTDERQRTVTTSWCVVDREGVCLCSFRKKRTGRWRV